MDQLIVWDQQFFFFINHSLKNGVMDALCPIFRNAYFWTPVYLFFMVYFIREYPGKWWFAIGGLLLTFVVLDVTSSSLIKPFVGRLRPCNDPYLKEYVNLLLPCGSGYSFTSTHAANHFGISFFLIQLLQPKIFGKLLLIFWAISVGFSQIYVGLHYPLDVVGGALVGIFMGSFIGLLSRYLIYKND